MEAKKIIITGGATRIGSAIAKSLAGYDVDIVIHFNKSRKSALQLKMELEEIGAKVFLIKADLSNINQTKKIVPFAYKKMKGLDCLINNASLFEKDDLENFSDKSFSKHLDINLKAPAFLIKDFKRYVKNKEANIINNIRVNGISPGPTLKNKRQSEKHFKAQWRSTILQKQVDLNNICASVKYFIENNSITGQIISVDSGQSLAWKTPDIINSKE